MRNPMLSLSPVSNDGSRQHKPTLASVGLNRCSRPYSDFTANTLQRLELLWSGLTTQ